MTAADGGRAPRRVVFLVPAAITLGNIFLGFFAIVKAFEESFLTATWCLFFAAVLDKFDGLIARKTGTTSDFGRELDSLADIISFGMAPALVSFAWGLIHLPKFGWAVSFLFLTCGALRLARFNVQPESADKRFFIGLPIPMAAAVPVTFVMLHASTHRERPGLAPDETGLAWLLLGILAVVAFLMVSRVRYLAFKQLHVERRHRLRVLLGLAVLIVLLAAFREKVLIALAFTYAAHGPVMHLASLRKKDRGPGASHSESSETVPETGEKEESE